MILRPDLLDTHSPQGVKVVQLTHEAGVPASHVYMEAQVFTPDSQRLLVHRSSLPHGSDRHNPDHQYLLCDLANHCQMTPVTFEVGATSPSISPDGRYIFYFIDETQFNGGRLTLKRVNLDGTDRLVLLVIDTPMPGYAGHLSQIYPLSTISSDGKRLAVSAFLGDGRQEGAPYGLLVFDLDRASAEVVIAGDTLCNMHPQYCRSTNPQAAHDILLQENHGCAFMPDGEITTLVGGLGADLHVLRDDGSNLRDLPFGRDPHEACQGHECWRGESEWVICSTMIDLPSEQQLAEGLASAHVGHIGLHLPGAERNVFSRSYPGAHFWHFGVDQAGKRLVSDAGGFGISQAIYLADLQAPGEPASNWRYLLTPRSHSDLGVHLHPFLSPDGRYAFFNSDESGVMQAYMITGLPGA